MKHQLMILIILSFQFTLVHAQELLCRVSVNHQQVQGSNTQVYQSLQKDITEFINNRRWTNHVYSQNEKIDCQILINISDYNGTDKFKGSLQISSTRPIFNTSYNSPIFNFKEESSEFQFEYIENQPLKFNETTFQSNLTSILAFYIYIVIGLDYDSFSSLGGNPFFQKAQRIVNNAQNSSFPGWRAYESKDQNNRYFLIDQLLDKNFEPLRKTYYYYHRMGLDLMSKTPDGARKTITESLRDLQKVQNVKPNAFLMRLFFTAKSDEIINIYSEAPPQEKQEVFTILKEIDVANLSKYQKIISRN